MPKKISTKKAIRRDMDDWFDDFRAADEAYRTALFSRPGATQALRRAANAVKKPCYNHFKGEVKDALRLRNAQKLASIPWRRAIITEVARSVSSDSELKDLADKAGAILFRICEDRTGPVISVARERWGMRPNKDDRQNIQEAVIMAAYSFPTDSESFASSYLLAAGLVALTRDDHFERMNTPVKVSPRHAGPIIKKMKDAPPNLTHEEMAEHIGVSVQRVKDLWVYAFPNEDGETPRDITLDNAEYQGITPETLTPEDEASHAEQTSLLFKGLALLDPEQRAVIEALFGIGTDKLTQAEVARDLGVSVAAVRNTKNAALTQLRSLMPKE